VQDHKRKSHFTKRLKRYDRKTVFPWYTNTKRRKQGGQVQIILCREENFIRGWFYGIVCILIFYGMFYSDHEICRDGLHLMIFMHVMNYFFYHLASILPGYLK
jgi:hypothetical protein